MEEEKSEICLSPSWSDFGGAKRKKEKKRKEKESKRLEEERKITQKGIKKELEKQKIAMIKEQKRLNKKPPPAAMDTQRMPAALRRNSVNSIKSFLGTGAPQDATKPSSEGRPQRERRWSFGSSRSRHSNPASSDDESPSPDQWQPVVSSNAPQLPKLTIGWHSRNASSDSQRTKSRDSDNGQGKDFFKLAYRLDAQPSSPEVPKAENPDLLEHRRRTSAGNQDPHRLRGMTRSQTDSQIPVLASASSTTQHPKAEAEKDTNKEVPKGPERKMSDSVPRIQQSPGQRAREIDANSGEGYRSLSVDKPEKPVMNPLRAHPVDLSRPKDGGSYCHKQRMYQQQRSIQGYEDEQAVIAANLPKVTHDSSRQEDESQLEPKPQAPVLSNHGSSILDRPRPPKLKGTGVVKTAKAQIHESPVEVTSATASLPPLTPHEPPSEKTSRRESKPRISKEVPPASETSATISPQEAYADPPKDVKRKSSHPQISKHTETLKRPSIPHLSHSSTYPSPSVPPNKPLESPTVFLRPHELKRASIDPAAPAEYELSDKRTTGDAVMMSPPSIANHSRTRTSSSQLLLDPLFQPQKAELFLPPTPTKPTHQEPTVTSQPDSEQPAVANTSQSNTNESIKKPRIPTSRQATDSSPNHSTAPELVAPKPSAPEVVVSTTTGEGVVRQTSIKRPRSNPQLNTIPPTQALPSLDFLPQLKHQPLPKPKRVSQSPQRPTSMAPKNSAQDFPVPPSPQANGTSTDLRIQPRSPKRLGAPSPTAPSTSSELPQPPAAIPRRRLAAAGSSPASTSNNSNALTSRNSAFGPLSTGRGASGGLEAKPLAKLFVICCKCKFWHDLPSKLYAAMSAPQMLSRDIAVPSARQQSSSNGNGDGVSGDGVLLDGGGAGDGKGKTGEVKTEQAQLDTMVKCPWCEHLMTTWCCAGWTTVVYLHERHH